MVGGKSTKDIIISSLGEHFPQTLRSIHNDVRSEKQVSNQAVHKTLRVLVEKNVIDKIGHQYSLNNVWVREQTSRFANIYTQYFRTIYSPNQVDERSKIQVCKFSSLKEMLAFVLEGTLQNMFGDSQNKIFISVKRLHPLMPDSVLETLRKLSENHEIFILCKNNSFADKWTAKLLKKMGVSVQTGVAIPHQNAVCVGSCVLQYFLFFSEKYKQGVHTFSDTFRGRSSMKLLSLTTNIFNKQAELYLIINRYPVFVQDIRDAIADEFHNT